MLRLKLAIGSCAILLAELASAQPHSLTCEEVQHRAAASQAELPKMVDSQTAWRSINIDCKRQTAHYVKQLLFQTRNDFQSGNIANIQEQIAAAQCTEDALPKGGWTVSESIYDKNKELIGTFSISPEACVSGLKQSVALSSGTGNADSPEDMMNWPKLIGTGLILGVATILAYRANGRLRQREPRSNPYFWGYFFSAGYIIKGSIGVIGAFFLLSEPANTSAILLGIGCTMLLIGFFMWHRDRWPWVLFVAVITILAFIIIVLSGFQLPGLISGIVALAFAFANGLYLKRRWQELG